MNMAMNFSVYNVVDIMCLLGGTNQRELDLLFKISI
jgi:hypothetical protein